MEDVARHRLQQYRAQKTSYLQIRLVDYVPVVSPELHAPEHLGPYADELERACPHNDNGEIVGGNVRVVIAAPPQHGKTELTLRAFLWWAIRYPGKRHCYVTYNADRVMSVARAFQVLAEQAGLMPGGTLEEITLKGGTTIKFSSIGGSLTGYPIDGVCVIDDPIKGPAEARSPTVRKHTIEWFDSVAFVRRHPGTSFVIMATRWHPEDLSGVLIKRGWRYVNLKAIAEGAVNDNGRVAEDPLGRLPGEALWPRHKPVEFFATDRKNKYWWASLFQGSPIPHTGTIFSAAPSFYTSRPNSGRGAFGIDLAYTASTHSDWSVCVEGFWYAGDEHFARGLYITDVVRKQVESKDFALCLKVKKAARPGWRMRWYASGTEKGAASFLTGAGIPLRVLTPLGDKLVRATAAKDPCSTGWNDGLILLPDPELFNVPWLPDFLDIVQNFTGIEDEHDDDVDALVALWDELRDPTINVSDVVALWGNAPDPDDER